NFWSETGLPGLAAFVWLMVQCVRTALRGLALGPWSRAMAIGLLGLVVAFGLHGLVDLPYFKNDQALAFWALVGVQLGSLYRHPRCGPAGDARAGPPVVIMALWISASPRSSSPFGTRFGSSCRTRWHREPRRSTRRLSTPETSRSCSPRTAFWQSPSRRSTAG